MKTNALLMAEVKLYKKLAEFWDKHLDNILVKSIICSLYAGVITYFVLSIILA